MNTARAKDQEELRADFIAACKAVVDVKPDRMPEELRAEFVAYWTEADAKGRMRFQAQDFFDHGRRMDTWRKRAEAKGGAFALKEPKPSTLKPWVN